MKFLCTRGNSNFMTKKEKKKETKMSRQRESEFEEDGVS